MTFFMEVLNKKMSEEDFAHFFDFDLDFLQSKKYFFSCFSAE
jgi:hypothetical protein